MFLWRLGTGDSPSDCGDRVIHCIEDTEGNWRIDRKCCEKGNERNAGWYSESGQRSEERTGKYYNMGSGKITAKEAVSTREDRKANGNDSTELLEKSKKKEKKFEETDILRPGINDYDTPDDGETEVLGSGADDEATDVLRDTSAGDDGATDVLRNDEGDDGATDVLRGDDEDATDVLRMDDDDSDATDVLRADDDDSDATDVLRADDDEEGTSVLTTGTLAKKVKVIYNIVVVHSDESIESGR